MLTRGGASAKRISEILDMPEELKPLPAPAGESAEEETISDEVIAFEHVTFSYGGAPALRDVNFVLRRGESLGVIGATGSGKSTLVSLLMRFYDADEGQVRVFGKDVRRYSPEELKSKFGAVFQSDFLMAASVRENIDFERGLSDEDIRRAARYACADKFIEEHDGYEGMLTRGGANYSGTDAAIRKTLLENLKDTAIVMIAQRISSVRFADKILVLEEGRAAGCGTDAELMRGCEEYRRIYASQHGEEGGGYACDK